MTPESAESGSPVTETLTMQFKVITYPYSESVGGVKYIYADNKIRYSVNSDGTTATVADQQKRSELVGEFTIPETIPDPDDPSKSYRVTKMAKAAFKDCKEITALTFLAPIDEFTGSDISANLNQYISGAPSLNGSGAGVFAGMEKLKKIDLSPLKITATGGAMFAFCYALTDVKMPDTLEELTKYDFLASRNLKTLNLRNTKLKKIGTYTNGIPNQNQKNVAGLTNGNGYYHVGIQKVYLPETVTLIESDAFKYSEDIRLITDLGSDENPSRPTPEQVQKYPYLTENTDVSNISHLANVTEVGSNAFIRGYKMGAILLPKATKIGGNAFSFHGVGWIRSMMLSDQLTSLTNSNALRLLPACSSITYSTQGVVYNSSSSVSYPLSVTLPPNLSNLGSKQTDNGTIAVNDIHIPSSLATIPATAMLLYEYKTQNMYSYRKAAPTMNASTFNYNSLGSTKPIQVLHVHPDATGYNVANWTKAYAAIKYDLGVKRSYTAGVWTALTFASRPVLPAGHGLTFYSIARKRVDTTGQATALLVNPVAEADLQPGIPYLVMPTLTKNNLVVDYAYGVQWAAQPAVVNGLHGTFDAVDGLSDVLTFNAQGEPELTATTCTNNAAYINLAEVGGGGGGGRPPPPPTPDDTPGRWCRRMAMVHI